MWVLMIHRWVLLLNVNETARYLWWLFGAYWNSCLGIRWLFEFLNDVIWNLTRIWIVMVILNRVWLLNSSKPILIARFVLFTKAVWLQQWSRSWSNNWNSINYFIALFISFRLDSKLLLPNRHILLDVILYFQRLSAISWQVLAFISLWLSLWALARMILAFLLIILRDWDCFLVWDITLRSFGNRWYVLSVDVFNHVTKIGSCIPRHMCWIFVSSDLPSCLQCLKAIEDLRRVLISYNFCQVWSPCVLVELVVILKLNCFGVAWCPWILFVPHLKSLELLSIFLIGKQVFV